jgi:hypothetical protein
VSASDWNDIGRQQVGGGDLRQNHQWLGQYPQAMPVKPPPPFSASDLVGFAERRIVEIDAELARVSELQAERERLVRIVGAK